MGKHAALITAFEWVQSLAHAPARHLELVSKRLVQGALDF